MFISDAPPIKPMQDLSKMSRALRRTGAIGEIKSDEEDIPSVAIPDDLHIDELQTDDGVFPVVRNSRGKVEDVEEPIYRIPLHQLRLAKQVAARLTYRPSASNPAFAQLVEQTRRLGVNERELKVVESGEYTKDVNGEVVPLYDVYVGIRDWHALREAKLPVARCVKRAPKDIADMLLRELETDSAHEPLTLLDWCMGVYTLITQYNRKQDYIAARTGKSQATISKMKCAVESQHPLILEFMDKDELGLEEVDMLRRAFDDLERRARAARYYIQQQLNRDGLRLLINQMNPPDGYTGPVIDLVPVSDADPDGMLRAIQPPSQTSDVESDAQQPPTSPPQATVFYLFRKRPVTSITAADVMRAARQVDVHVAPRTDGQPGVPDWEHLAVFQMLHRLRAGEIPSLKDLELLYLADLQQMANQAKDLPQHEGEREVEAIHIVDAS